MSNPQLDSQPFFRFASVDGLGVTVNINQDYSVTPGSIRLVCGASERLYVSRLIVTIRDTGGTAEKYGNITGGLTNGIHLNYRDTDGTLLSQVTADKAIQTNTDWGAYCYDVDRKAWGSGDVLFFARWTALKSGTFFELTPGQYVEVAVSDDFTGLVGHYFHFQGVADPQ